MSPRRSYYRYALTAPVMCSWRIEGVRHVVRGIVRDMSANGIYIFAPQSPPKGAVIRCDVLLPAFERELEGSGAQVRASSVGRVVRCGADERPSGFAIRSRCLVLREEGSGCIDHLNAPRHVREGKTLVANIEHAA